MGCCRHADASSRAAGHVKSLVSLNIKSIRTHIFSKSNIRRKTVTMPMPEMPQQQQFNSIHRHIFAQSKKAGFASNTATHVADIGQYRYQ
ncbi:hypothetical protein NPIL_622891 [Nephila pilipes]|uniref:Uncharacterized protein n=1 Tax=Nephila pilipes TaxID=299642 RepID=A0A8X6MX16_NEPPI|nr:hypothetical protein NPIL_622891 [Nephila pilipes]